jgi:hypothetical protein
VVAILKGTLRIGLALAAILDPFTGFVLAMLLRGGLIERLNQLTGVSQKASAFLNQILPLAHQSAGQAEVTSLPHGNDHLLLDLPQTMFASRPVVTPSSVEKMLQCNSDPSKWDWSEIIMLFTVVLPHSDEDAQASQAKWIYAKIIRYFSDDFLKVDSKRCNEIAEAFYVMIRLFLGRKTWGVPLLQKNVSLRESMQAVLGELAKDRNIEPGTAKWSIFKCIAMMVCHEEGNAILKNWGLLPKLYDLCDKCHSEKLCVAILDVFSFDVGEDYLIPVFHRFLNSTSPRVHQLALNDLRKKRAKTKDFHEIVFRALLLTHVREMANCQERLILDINFLGEIISTDERSLKTVVGDPTLPLLIQQHSHFIFAILCSQPQTLRLPIISDELEWWMTVGLTKYCEVYDRAVKGVFHDQLDVSITKEPSIFQCNGTVMTPPHLFSEMARTDEGIQLLLPLVHRLLDSLESGAVLEIRAAFFALGHFGSIPATEPFIRDLRVPERLIAIGAKHPSYVLKGTLIASLSLFTESPYLSSVLQSHNWQLFRFGNRQAVIPCDPQELLLAFPMIQTAFPSLPDLPQYSRVTTELKRMSNTLIYHFGQEHLRTLRDSRDPMLFEPELARYAHSLLAAFHYESPLRRDIYTSFSNTPVVPLTIELPNDDESLAYVSARVREMVSNKRSRVSSDITLATVTVPVYSRQQLRTLQPVPRCPEVYLPDLDLKAAANLTRDEFYALLRDKQTEVRSRILKT